MATPAELIRDRARFEVVKRGGARVAVRGHRIDRQRRRRNTCSEEMRERELAAEQQALAELIHFTNDWHVLDRLTPRQMTVLLLIAVEGNTQRVADRLCVQPQTVKNHITAIRQTAYGEQYVAMRAQVTSLSPIIALAVRWALDYEERTRPTGDSGEREQG